MFDSVLLIADLKSNKQETKNAAVKRYHDLQLRADQNGDWSVESKTLRTIRGLDRYNDLPEMILGIENQHNTRQTQKTSGQS